MSDAPLLQVIIAGTSRKTGAEIKKLSDLPASIFQISRSDAWNLTISPDAARNMRDLASQIGAGMPKYLIAPEVSLLLSYIDDLNIRMYFETLWNTGARLNEALALKPADFMLTPTAVPATRGDPENTQATSKRSRKKTRTSDHQTSTITS